MFEKTFFVLSPSYHGTLGLLRQRVPVDEDAPRRRQTTMPEGAGQ